MRAIISDVHANLEALQAVLSDIEQQGADEIYCLGDIIDDGPNPRECIDLLMGCRVVLMGERDRATLFAEEGGYDPGYGYESALWTRNELESPVLPEEDRKRRWNFLANCPQTHQEGQILYVHGSPRNPLGEGVFPEEIYKEAKMRRVFERVERHCFHGRTHAPGIITDDRQFLSPEDVDFVYRLGALNVLCNVGSVGQPRDDDPRACYVLLDGRTVQFRRVEYDLEATLRKLDANPDLPNFLRTPPPQVPASTTWMSARDPDDMLLMLLHRPDWPGRDRKLRLFTCACCRRLSALLVDERSRNALNLLEQSIDGIIPPHELAAARMSAWHAARSLTDNAERLAAEAVGATLAHSLIVRNVLEATRRAVAESLHLLSGAQAAALHSERNAQMVLLREIVGNPFRRPASPTVWPAAVVQLAQAQNAGGDCAFALHDALIDAGYPELAAHFREPVHPKGCWVVDLILGKA